MLMHRGDGVVHRRQALRPALRRLRVTHLEDSGWEGGTER